MTQIMEQIIIDIFASWLYDKLKKHHNLISEMMLLGLVGFPAFVAALLISFLKLASPKKIRRFSKLYEIFTIRIIREATMPFIFVALDAVA